VVFGKVQTETLRLKSIWFARTQESCDSRVSGLIVSAGTCCHERAVVMGDYNHRLSNSLPHQASEEYR
jgi:hypothetical protein